MARRKNDVGIFEILVKLPWWLALALGVSCYVYLKVSPPPVGVFPDPDFVVRIFVQFFQWMCFGAAVVSGFHQLIRKILFASAKDLEAIRAMSWRDFEKLVSEAYRRQGYRVEETGGGGADGGIDLLLHGKGGKIIVQCKQWKAFSVGVKVIREMFGVMVSENADRVIIVTSGKFTDAATRFARGKPIDLINGKALVQLINSAKAGTAPSKLKVAPTMPQPVSSEALEPETPPCPLCGSTMILRTAKRGAQAGNRFWGCSTYPKCRGTLAVD